MNSLCLKSGELNRFVTSPWRDFTWGSLSRKPLSLPVVLEVKLPDFVRYFKSFICPFGRLQHHTRVVRLATPSSQPFHLEPRIRISARKKAILETLEAHICCATGACPHYTQAHPVRRLFPHPIREAMVRAPGFQRTTFTTKEKGALEYSWFFKQNFGRKKRTTCCASDRRYPP